MKKIGILVALSMLLLAILACSFGGKTSPTPVPSQRPTEPPQTESPQTGNQVALTIVNNMTEKSICYVYITLSDADTWGDNWLGSDESIAAGRTIDLQMDPGSYDLNVMDCDQKDLMYEWNFDLTTAKNWIISDPVTLTIVNNMTDKSLCTISVARPDADVWGGSWLGENSIASGTTYDLQVGPDIYDLRAKDCDGNVLAYEWSVDLTQPANWTINDPVTLTISNTSEINVCYLYLTPPDTDTWGGSWLGDESIAAGSTFELQANPGIYDLKAKDCDENVLAYEWGVDLTVPVDWTVANPVTLTINNNSQISVCAIQIARPEADTWGGNWLSDESIDSGASYELRVNPGLYDMRAKDCDGNEITTNIDVDMTIPQVWDIQ